MYWEVDEQSPYQPTNVVLRLQGRVLVGELAEESRCKVIRFAAAACEDWAEARDAVITVFPHYNLVPVPGRFNADYTKEPATLVQELFEAPTFCWFFVPDGHEDPRQIAPLAYARKMLHEYRWGHYADEMPDTSGKSR